MEREKTPFCWKRLCWKSCLISGEVLLALVAFMLVLALVFVWRLSSSPLDLEFARSGVERALSNRSADHIVTIDQLILHWPDRKGPLLLGVRGGEVSTTDGVSIVDVDEVGIGLSLPHLLIGQIVPTSLVLHRPNISVVVDASGVLNVGLGNSRAEAAYITETQQSLLEKIVGYVGTPYRNNDDSPLAALERFEIRGAVLDVEDQFNRLNWLVPRFDLILQTQESALVGRLGVHVQEGGELPDLTVGFEVPWQAETANFSVGLNDFPLSYVADKIEDRDFQFLNEVVLSLSGTGVLDSDLNPTRFSVERGGFELAAVPFMFDGAVERDASGYDARLSLRAARVDQNKFVKLLPDFLSDEGVYEWLTRKISGGYFSNLTADAEVRLESSEQGWGADLVALRSGFDYRDSTIAYKDGLLPITQAEGSGWFDYISEILHVDLKSGEVGALKARNGKVELAHIVEGGKGVADVNLSLFGALSDVFMFLEREPIGFNHGYDLARVQGMADLNVNVGLPVTRDVTMDDVRLQVRGHVDDAVLPDVLQGEDLRAAQVDVVVDGNDVVVDGDGVFVNNTTRFEYNGFLSSVGKPYEEKIKVSSVMDQKMRDIFDLDLSSFLDGAFNVDAVYTKYSDKRQVLDVNADLKAARLFVDALAYEKAVGDSGRMRLQVNFEDGDVSSITQLSAQAGDLKLSGGALDFEVRAGKVELVGGRADEIIIGKTVGVLEFEVMDDGAYKLSPSFSMLDLRPILAGGRQDKDLEDSEPLMLVISADTILTHGESSVRGGKIYADIDSEGRFNQLELDALTSNGSDIYLRYKPDDEGDRVFRFEADDAGQTLEAFGLYDKIKGGKILIYADPMRGAEDRNLGGVAEISNFEVVGAPTLAKLLGLMSLDGLANGLSNTGLQFSRLESKFDWLYRPQGSLLVLEDGRTSGAAVGLTFDGVVDQAVGTIDLSGTLVPVSDVNNVIRSIPVLGDILTGGSGVFAATYSVKGKTDDPKVSVNPLSVLAPGILRRILFE